MERAYRRLPSLRCFPPSCIQPAAALNDNRFRFSYSNQKTASITIFELFLTCYFVEFERRLLYKATLEYEKRDAYAVRPSALTTFSLSASSSCEKPFDFLRAWMFSFSMADPFSRPAPTLPQCCLQMARCRKQRVVTLVGTV